MNLRMAAPTHVIDVARTEDMRTIEVDVTGLKVGAAATYREVAAHSALAEFALLGVAISHVGHAPIRNRGTLVGSIAHNDPAGELPAVALVCDAEVMLRSTRGARSVAIGDFLTTAYSTTIEEDELVEWVRFPRPETGDRFGFAEYARRPGDYAVAGVVCRVRSQPDGSVAAVRAATFACGGAVRRHHEAEERIVGAGQDGLDIDLAADALALSATDASDTYLRRLVHQLAEDAFKQALP